MLCALLLTAGFAAADEPKLTAAQIYEQATLSLVAVQYAWVDELNRRELIGAGIIVGGRPERGPFDTGLVSPADPR